MLTWLSFRANPHNEQLDGSSLVCPGLNHAALAESSAMTITWRVTGTGGNFDSLDPGVIGLVLNVGGYGLGVGLLGMGNRYSGDERL
mmetsp:Transcript_12335/g.22200  ORF Transcript_12335/g.22200 Transcript_12335/m.22200 type:complete len:87 (+) Transcript_12335:885-1145(+)